MCVQIRMLYVNFAMVHYPADEASRLMYVPLYYFGIGIFWSEGAIGAS